MSLNPSLSPSMMADVELFVTSCRSQVKEKTLAEQAEPLIVDVTRK